MTTLYETPNVRVLVDEMPNELWVNFETGEDGAGLVTYTIEDLQGTEWMTVAQLDAPMFDRKVRSEVATEALRLADEAEAKFDK